MICRACAYDTDRLLVREWHSAGRDEWSAQDLARFVVEAMTEPVTHSLPPSWQGPYTQERARDWIAERDGEGPTLLIVERSTHQAIGLMILFESTAENQVAGVDVRLGYLLAESAWGKGLASELIAGFVAWCRADSRIESLAGGVDRDNVASARVLEKNGFRAVTGDPADPGDDRLFELNLHR